MKSLPQRGFRHALIAALYIALIAFILWNIEKLNMGPVSFIGPMLFLMLFVLSAAIMASVIFGKPLMLYLDNKKKEAVQLVGWTLGWFAGLTVLTFALLSIV